MLRFVGRGSAFADEHNCAFFEEDGDLVILDCSMTSFVKLKRMDLSSYKHVYVLVTHTHGDHISGIGMLVDIIYFIAKIPITVVAPSEAVGKELLYYLTVIEACSEDWFELICSDALNRPWFDCAIATTHTENLAGKCFGYSVRVHGNSVIFTGDTATLEPFEKYLTPGAYLYTEVSAYNSPVHLYCETIHDKIKALVDEGVKVYLMHMDEEDQILAVMADTGALPAPLWDVV